MVASSKSSDVIRLNNEQITWYVKSLLLRTLLLKLLHRLQSLTLDVIMQVTDYASVAKCSELFNRISQITTTSMPP